MSLSRNPADFPNRRTIVGGLFPILILFLASCGNAPETSVPESRSSGVGGGVAEDSVQQPSPTATGVPDSSSGLESVPSATQEPISGAGSVEHHRRVSPVGLGVPRRVLTDLFEGAGLTFRRMDDVDGHENYVARENAVMVQVVGSRREVHQALLMLPWTEREGRREAVEAVITNYVKAVDSTVVPWAKREFRRMKANEKSTDSTVVRGRLFSLHSIPTEQGALVAVAIRGE